MKQRIPRRKLTEINHSECSDEGDGWNLDAMLPRVIIKSIPTQERKFLLRSGASILELIGYPGTTGRFAENPVLIRYAMRSSIDVCGLTR